MTDTSRSLVADASAGTDTRNEHGVKYSTDCWRTFNGVRYRCWTSCPPTAMISAYRAAGLRVRRQGVELYIHPEDEQRASEIDFANNSFES